MALASSFNIPVPDATPATAGNLLQSFQNSQAIAEPALSAIDQQTTTKLNQLSKLRQMTPEGLRKLTDSGTLLSATLGFNNPSEFRGMTLDEYNQSIAPKESPADVLAKNLKVADEITGTTELRQNLVKQAERNATQRGNAVQNSLNFGQAQQNLRDTQTFTGNDKVRQNEFDAGKTQVELAEKSREFNASNSIAQQRLALERTRLTYVKDAADAAAKGQSGPAGTAPDANSMTKFDTELKAFGAVKKDGTGFDLSGVSGSNKKPALQAYLRKEAATGLPFNQIYQLDPSHGALFGSNRLILGKAGWHAITKDKQGRDVVSEQPVVPYMQNAKPKSSGSGGNAGATAQPVYDLGE